MKSNNALKITIHGRDEEIQVVKERTKLNNADLHVSMLRYRMSLQALLIEGAWDATMPDIA
jgi:hypothetical protein